MDHSKELQVGDFASVGEGIAGIVISVDDESIAIRVPLRHNQKDFYCVPKLSASRLVPVEWLAQAVLVARSTADAPQSAVDVVKSLNQLTVWKPEHGDDTYVPSDKEKALIIEAYGAQQKHGGVHELVEYAKMELARCEEELQTSYLSDNEISQKYWAGRVDALQSIIHRALSPDDIAGGVE